MPRRLSRLSLLLVLALTWCVQRDARAFASSTRLRTARDAAQVALAPLHVDAPDPIVVGASVRVSAEGLPPGARVDLSWGTIRSRWLVEDGHRVHGTRATATVDWIGASIVEADGWLRATIEVPEDFGGSHTVTASVDGRPVARGDIVISPTVTLQPTSGPVATPIELRITGMDPRSIDEPVMVKWDQHEMGVVTAVGTSGSAVARFRAAGPVGTHTVSLNQGSAPTFTFVTTSGLVRDIDAESFSPQPMTTELEVAGTLAFLEPSQGPGGTRTVLRGEGFAPDQAFTLSWETSIRPRRGGKVETEETVLASVRADPDGRFAQPVTIPDDFGGAHALILRDGRQQVARVHFFLETAVVDMRPRSGAAGTPVSVRLRGVGWTDHDGHYLLTYDNAYLEAFGDVNRHGDVVVTFTATGEPGAHVVDLYPGISRDDRAAAPAYTRLPHLSYAEDHPGSRLPAIRLTFVVTP